MPNRCAGALCLQCTFTTTFASSNVNVGPVSQAAATIIQLLPCGTQIAIAFRLISKTLGTVVGAPLSVDTVASSHVRGDIPIGQPLQKLSVPVGGIGRHRFCLSSLPVREPCDHVLCRDRLLTHASCRGLHPHDHTTGVVDEIVVVVPQPSRRPSLGRVGGIGICSRHLVLLVYRLFHRVLLFHFLQVLPHRAMDLGSFRQLLAWNATLLRRIGFHESAFNLAACPVLAPLPYTAARSAQTVVQTALTLEIVRAGSWRTWNGAGSLDRNRGQ